MTKAKHGPLRVGSGCPVGTGKTGLMDPLWCRFVNQCYFAA